MYCSNCGKELKETDQFCGHCGQKVLAEIQSCKNCGASVSVYDSVCPECGYQIQRVIQRAPIPKSRVLAGLLGIFFGTVGVHNFYLGNSSKGFFQVVLFFMGIFTVGLTTLIAFLWGFIEGVMILAGHIDSDVDGNKLQK